MKWIVVRPQFKWQLWDFTRQAVQRMWFVEKKYILSAPSWVPTSWLIKSHLTELGTWEFYYGCRHVNTCFCNSYHIQNHNLLLKAITVSCMPLKGSSGRHTWSLSRSLVSSSKEVWWKKWPKKLQNCFCKIQNHNLLLKAITVSCMPLKGSSGRYTRSLSRSLVSSSKEVLWKNWHKKLQNCRTISHRITLIPLKFWLQFYETTPSVCFNVFFPLPKKLNVLAKYSIRKSIGMIHSSQ